ncbi:hypothetical protein DVV14_25140 (plasmid) [Vibrio coralliilyticus]|nr:hypothetical protein [Vibrio coralliilyticus]AXN34588.1 hypothetical protein DVV14_25140 [Vibrio coralliilyticus]
MYTVAEESLIKFAERIDQDIPGSCQLIKPSGHIEELGKIQRCSLDGLITNNAEESREPLGYPNWSILDSGQNMFQPYTEGEGIDELRLDGLKQKVIEAFM